MVVKLKPQRVVLLKILLGYFSIILINVCFGQELPPANSDGEIGQLSTRAQTPITIPENTLPPTRETPWRQIDANNPIPIMAYYYIWFDEPSWNRAKTDYPLIGRYSSDDRTVMEKHVQLAKEVGITGFIVSWKSTFKLDNRLEQLMDIAANEDFSLWIIYQGLDFDREPLPLAYIDNDLQFFLDRYANHSVFQMYDLPIVIWSGTWEFTVKEVEEIASGYRNKLYILATERNLKGYSRLAHLVDGNAYYWSSVNPETFPKYLEKLSSFSEKVHEHGGLWVAPAAPGFDARLIGGNKVVERKGGDTLRSQLDTALQSSPDVIGLISWNEFSENTHIEPSENYGTSSLDVLADRHVAAPLPMMDFDSSAPGKAGKTFYSFYVLGGLLIFIASSVLITFLRHVKRGADQVEQDQKLQLEESELNIESEELKSELDNLEPESEPENLEPQPKQEVKPESDSDNLEASLESGPKLESKPNSEESPSGLNNLGSGSEVGTGLQSDSDGLVQNPELESEASESAGSEESKLESEDSNFKPKLEDTELKSKRDLESSPNLDGLDSGLE